MTLQERFEQRYIPEPNSGCWLWVGTQHTRGYGRIQKEVGSRKKRAKLERAHRVAWELYRGPIPTDMHVLHRCDVTSCVNPDHLFLGTQTDNMADKYRKNRANHVCGENTHNAKLDCATVKKIRANPGITNREWAKLLGVSKKTVWKARTGNLWRHVQ